MEAQHISVRELAKQADVSPTVIQKLRSKNSQKVNLTTFTSVLRCLGYQIKLEKMPALKQEISDGVEERTKVYPVIEKKRNCLCTYKPAATTATDDNDDQLGGRR